MIACDLLDQKWNKMGEWWGLSYDVVYMEKRFLKNPIFHPILLYNNITFVQCDRTGWPAADMMEMEIPAAIPNGMTKKC